MGHHVERYFDTLYRFLDGQGLLRAGEYSNQIRITSQLRQTSNWSTMEEAWDVLSQFTLAISNAMSRLARGLSGLDQFDVINYDDLLSSVSAAARHLEQVHQQLGAFATNPH